MTALSWALFAPADEGMFVGCVGGDTATGGGGVGGDFTGTSGSVARAGESADAAASAPSKVATASSAMRSDSLTAAYAAIDTSRSLLGSAATPVVARETNQNRGLNGTHEK